MMEQQMSLSFKMITEEKKRKLSEIANKLGTSLNELLKQGEPDGIIESYEKGNLKLLNE